MFISVASNTQYSSATLHIELSLVFYTEFLYHSIEKDDTKLVVHDKFKVEE